MKLKQLNIQTMPGIEPGFVLDEIAPGVNIVTGPNGIGKSSLIRALVYLVGEPRADDPGALSLSAVFDAGDARWTVRRTGREVAWERDGHLTDRPPLPDRDQLYCYWLSMENLLAADERDEQLVAELRRALSGGYDLESLRREEPFGLGARWGHTEARRLREAEKSLRDVEVEYEALRRDETRIPELDADVGAARQAGVAVKHLEDALALLDARRARQQVEAVLAAFATNMPRLRGDELSRIEQLASRRRALLGGIEAQTRESDLARERLQQTGLAAERPDPQELAARARDLQEARHKHEQVEQEQMRLERHRTTEQEALSNLGGQTNTPTLDPQSISDAENLARDLQAAELRRQALTDRLNDVGELPDQTTIDRHFQAAEALNAWLAAAQSRSTRPAIPMLIAAVAALIAAVAALAAQAWLALACASIALISVLWGLLRRPDDVTAAARQRFAESEIDPPDAWQAEAVKERLQTIEHRRAELLQVSARRQQAEDDRREIERLEATLEDLQARKSAMAEQFGFDPTLTASALDRFVRLVQNYDQARLDRISLEAAIGRLNSGIAESISRTIAFLDRWSVEHPDETLGTLEALLTDLGRRVEEAVAAEGTMRDCERELQRLNRELKTIEEDEHTLYRDAGLEPGQREMLEECSSRLESWREQQDRLRDAQILETQRRAALEGEDLLLQRVDADDGEGLHAELELNREQAGNLESRQEELATLRERLRGAGREKKLENAAAHVDIARAALEDRYDAAQLAEAAHLLLDTVESEHRGRNEPEVLRDARDRFRRFTHHAFDLELDDKAGFVARDLQQQAMRSLSELSSATRMQLLLAVRLAWTRQLERGRNALPLFLDEALTTSDERRFAQVAESLEQAAREEDRQAFYLSARREELALWERTMGGPAHHVDLAEIRFGRNDTPAQDFRLPDLEPLPSPGGMTAEAYARLLGVPPVDPTRPIGGMHVFHLLRDDLALLHRLMNTWRITTVGQLEGLLRSAAAAAAIHDSALGRKLEGRAITARFWIDAWRHGRSKIVDRIALEESGVVTPAFIDKVAALAEDMDHDGALLIDALRASRVARFRTSNIDELEQWLKAEGYIVTDTPLTAEDRARQTLLNAAGRVNPDDIGQTVQWLESGLAE